MYFSVKIPLKIGKKTYIPCVCYPVTETVAFTVEHLEKEGKAVTYPEKVFFQNGKVITKQETTEVLEVLEEVKEDVKEDVKTEKKGRKEKKQVEDAAIVSTSSDF